MALIVASPFADPNSPGAMQTPISEVVKSVLPAPAPKVESAPKSKASPKPKAEKKVAEKKAAAPSKPKAAKKKVAAKKGAYDFDLEERVVEEKAVAAEDAADTRAAAEAAKKAKAEAKAAQKAEKEKVSNAV